MYLKFKVGDLFQAKTGFMGEWIDNKVFLLVDINKKKEDGYILYCQENGRTISTTAFTLRYNMLKLNDIEW